MKNQPMFRQDRLSTTPLGALIAATPGEICSVDAAVTA